ncbi:MAG: putative alpha/beta superfamily hydrolase [Flavobacteriales bacterium]|jgi:predicted alpha/beta superfamily hydrolase
MLGSLKYDKYVPEMIVVGIGYDCEDLDLEKLRQIDYTPVVSRADTNSGDAKAFLQFIETQVIPYSENNFRVDSSFSVLVGGSYGGLFGLYAMFEKPELFQGIISSSPAILYGRRWIIQREIDFYWGNRKELWLDEPSRSLPVRLFMTVGDQETEFNWKYEAKAFDQLISRRGYKGFEYEFHVMEGFHHGGVKYPTFSRGMAFMFKPYMVSRQPD